MRLFITAYLLFNTFLLCDVASASESPERLVVMAGDAVPPYMLMIGDKGNWSQNVGSDKTLSANEVIEVTTDPEGFKTIAFVGRGEGQAYLQINEPQDYSRYAESKSALVITMKVNKKPTKDVMLRMACGYPCQGEINIAGILKQIPENTWGNLSFSLKCFTDSGLNVKNVMSPMALFASTQFSVSVAQVSIVPGLGEQANIKC